MIPRAPLTGACVAALVAGIWAAPAPPQTPQAQQPARPVFRSSADVVFVPVSVKGKDSTTDDLKAADFALTDNGVPQRVEIVSGESVSADISILVETSSAVREYIGSLDAQVKKIAALVRPNDRLEIIGIDTYVNPLLPLSPAHDQPSIGPLSSGGLASVNDAMVAALLREPDAERRHLIIVISDTVDTMSQATMETVRDVAKLSNATLEVAWPTMFVVNRPPDLIGICQTASERAGIASGASDSESRARYWVPHVLPPLGRKCTDFQPLIDAAASTGGAVHFPGVFTDRTAAAIFEKLYAEFRHSYILRFTPSGVTRDGWHDLAVSIPSMPGAEIKAKRGYFIDPPPPPKVVPATGTLESLTQAASDGDVAGAREAIRSAVPLNLMAMLKEFTKGVPAIDGSPRREFVVALLLGEMGLSRQVSDPRLMAASMLMRYGKLVEQVAGTDGFARFWQNAQLALFEAPVRPADATKALGEALERWPKDPRVLLARAVLMDQQWPIGMASSGSAPRSRVPTLVAYYDAAIDAAVASSSPATAAEARVRKAYFLMRMARAGDALQALTGVDDVPGDVTLNFWRRLVLGRTLDALDRSSDAVDAFRSAVALIPLAQSAHVGLMDALIRSGDVAGAREESERIQTLKDADDPWWSYWQADYRFFEPLLARLWEMTQ